ncbi:9527_t:CDS:2 [Diversispora eburnea]|uniref:Splicing factor YJU2 n=1 Tax=Diversispora eburnea TaxID=1213867 RepID=A0A9N9B392_9GLOM|nr:9527_t:CDS:2 [Diversispora eburnea]
MSERKVLNKYFPPDFDPAIPRRKQAKDAQHKVRLMTPYAMRCETCGEYIYKGKKFNARKETVEGETYYSIKIFRFYIKCPRCSAEITFKTDPQSTDYIAEHGASRNFEPWREEKLAGEESKLQKELEEENNPMKALENRTIDSKREMDILDALDEIRTRNARNERINSDVILDKLVESDQINEDLIQEGEEREDELLAKAIFHNMDGDMIKRIKEEEQPTNWEL